MHAKDYYYKLIAPEEQGQNYQQTHQYEGYYTWERAQQFLSPLEKEPGFSQKWNSIYRYVPDRSNDALLNWILEEIETKVESNIKKRMHNMFIAKRNDLEFNAFACQGIQEFTGDLVFLHVGLSDACFQYSILFEEYLQLQYTKNDTAAKLIHADHLMRIKQAQQKWKLYGDYIKLDKETFLVGTKEVEEGALELAVMNDMFILGHEIAHHLLGQTGREDIGSELIELLPNNCQMWHIEHQSRSSELKADALALLLVAGVANKTFWNNPTKDEYALQAAIGSLLALTVLGQCSADPNKPTDTHPSVTNRQEQCMRILEIITPTNEYEIVKKDIIRFQSELFFTQRHGLGINDDT
jgi:Zn-dependent protease with chaperone function